jgi:phenylalanyl-tRNA synthetase alpha chain
MRQLELLEQLRGLLDSSLREADSLEAVRQVERRLFHPKRGLVRELTRGPEFAKMPEDDKRRLGSLAREFEKAGQLQVAERLDVLGPATSVAVADLAVDPTLPTGRERGSIHPVMLIQQSLEEIFRGLGFMVDEGFEVETEYFNFDAVNVSADHPARDMQDTFWLENGLVLRTHTSASQVRALRTHGTPLRVIFPGRCFRQEETDASHETSFYQCEGLMVDRGVGIAHLLAVMQAMLAQVFQRDVRVRLRPGYFPFVEPGFELDLGCLICDGAGCRVCKQSGWVELMPCGMVHPKVLEAGGVPSGFTGFAFGLGMTRLAMMKYGVPDIRLFDSGDLRFHRQFPAWP